MYKYHKSETHSFELNLPRSIFRAKLKPINIIFWSNFPTYNDQAKSQNQASLENDLLGYHQDTLFGYFFLTLSFLRTSPYIYVCIVRSSLYYFNKMSVKTKFLRFKKLPQLEAFASSKGVGPNASPQDPKLATARCFRQETFRGSDLM